MVFRKSTFSLILVLAAVVIGTTVLIIYLVAESERGTVNRQNLQQNQDILAAYSDAVDTETAAQSAVTTTAAVTTAGRKDGSYEVGYQAGYAAGVADGNSQTSLQAAEQSAYERGYAAGKKDAADPESANAEAVPEQSAVTVTVSGSFTATVRAVLPDYQTDDTILQAAVMQFDKDSLFVMKIAPEVCKLLTANETYTFLVDEQQITVPNREYLLDDSTLSADILKQQYIAVGSVRAPRDSENSSYTNRLTYKFAETDNKGENT